MRIGVFDSGIGGITVLSEIRKKLGSVDYIYLGDTAHLPYGTKSPAQVERLSVDCARQLKDKKVDVLIVACNTASSLAIESIRAAMSPVPVFGMVEPGVEAVLSALASLQKNTDGKSGVEKRPRPTSSESPPILVLATRATVRSGAYGIALRKHSLTAMEQACPLLVPMIEEGWIDHSILHQTLAVYVGSYLAGAPGVALLGCTHYPWIISAVERSLPGWIVIDSAHAVASTLEGLRLDFPSALERKASPFPDSKFPPVLESKVPTALESLGVKLSKVIGGSAVGGVTGEKAARAAGARRGKIEWIFTDPDAVPAFAAKMIQSMNLGEI